MEPAVSVKLAGVLGQVTSPDDLEDVNYRLQGEEKDRPVAFSGPHSRRNPWQPQGSDCKSLLGLWLVIVEAAVAQAVGEVDDEAEDEPDGRSNPGLRRQLKHHPETQ